MFSQIRDPIGRSLLLLFLIKPLIDLTYFMSLSIGGIRLAPTNIFAALLFVYLIRFRFQPHRERPPYAALFEVFIALNFIAILIGVFVNERLTLVRVLDFMLRLLDSYLVYVATFLAAMRYRYRDATPFFKAIVIGSSIVVVMNVFAVQFGISPGAWESKAGSGEAADFRLAGLYGDPGVLANVAFFNLIFGIFLLHLAPTRRKGLIALAALLAVADLYLIAVSKSRAGMSQLLIFGLVYLLLFQKSWGKIVAPIAAAATLAASIFIFGIDLDEAMVRFQSDVAALEGDGDSEVGVSAEGEVSLGKFEGLGSNRVALWADAITALLKRPVHELLMGTFTTSVSHSDILDIVARSGLVSLIVYLTMLIGLTIQTWGLAWRLPAGHDRTLYYMSFTLLLCYLFYSLPFRPLSYTTTGWYMWTVIALAMARSRMARVEAAESLQSRRAGRTNEVPNRGLAPTAAGAGTANDQIQLPPLLREPRY